MTITTDRNHPGLEPVPEGQQEAYLVLEERAGDFVRPYRDTYVHVGDSPKYPLRDLTEEEQSRYATFGYVKFEQYPESMLPLVGRYVTKAGMSNHGCGMTTTMGKAIAETYARQPKFYGGTYCAHCEKHYPVAEFRWKDGTVVGS